MQQNQKSTAWLAVLLLAFIVPVLHASSDDDNDDFDWFELEKQAREVNEGELEFLASPPQKPVHHHQNKLVIKADSLKDGWVHLRQCHSNIDNVSRAQILFRKGRIRNMRITEATRIEKAWIEGASVQLTNIGKQSTLCLEAESLILRTTENGGYRIKNGPYMRRFLDGYYPMRVSMQIDLADSGLQFVGITPKSQPGFEVQNNGASISFDAWFEGRLRTEIELQKADAPLARLQ